MFGLINQQDPNIQVYFDRAMLDEPVLTFHPDINTQTIFIKTNDILRFVRVMGYEYEVLDLR
ncbi:hypothetical protein DCM90_03680 [Levilactobacillus bambusae]|uniref:YbaK/aminoacyl-tRNA synthetase-associated domain-containing protein n=2 Tax=Levilactobacillus bambusae TaxID=2024736 RepID=A0A2V1MYK0_9LACO|nr:hypothetical protein DCM90_03680 [Levilactobacillus bambusae]